MAGQVNKSVEEKDIDALLEKKLNEMLAKAQEQADKIVADAEKKAKEIQGIPTDEELAKVEAEIKRINEEAEELVDVFIPRMSKEDADRYISVNGQNCLIQTGKHIKVKRKFAEVLWRSEEQKATNMDMIAELTSEFENKSKNL